VYQRLQRLSGAIADAPCQKQIVEDDEVGVEHWTQLALLLSRTAQRILGKHTVGLQIPDIVALQSRLIGNRLSDMTLARTKPADDQGILTGGNEFNLFPAVDIA
jgi:hypothetical protein